MEDIFDFQNEDRHTTDINVDSLWLIDMRDSSGKHSNIYHGNFVPQIPRQMIKRYTEKGDTVLDIFPEAEQRFLSVRSSAGIL